MHWLLKPFSMQDTYFPDVNEVSYATVTGQSPMAGVPGADQFCESQFQNRLTRY